MIELSHTDSNLPEGWTESPVGDLVEMKYGKGLIKEKRRTGKVPVYGSNGIVGRHDEGVTTGPTIIIGRKGSVGEVHLSTVGCWPIDTTYFIDAFGPFDYAFLADALRALQLWDLDQSSAIPGLNREQAYGMILPVPPLPEQKRIVAKVEELLARVNAARERLAKAPALLKRFRQSVLAAACSGQLTADWREEHAHPSVQINDSSEASDDLPASWVSTMVGDVIEGLKYGTSKKCDYLCKGLPVLRIPNIGEGTITQADMKYTDLDPKELNHLRLRPGDLLMIRSNGSVSLLGKTALVSDAEAGFAYAGYLIRIRPKPSKVFSPFLNAVLGSFGVRLQIEMPARSTSGVNNINSDEVRELRFFLPPLAEQHEIVRRVEALFAFANKIEARVKSATARFEKITQAILAKAFRGELVPTEAELARREGRDYEPASVLLDRIRAARSAGNDGPARPSPRRSLRKQKPQRDSL